MATPSRNCYKPVSGEKNFGVNEVRDRESFRSGQVAAATFCGEMADPMSKEIVTTNIRGAMVMLGTGTSVGVPIIGCGCDVCRSDNPRNRRTRCSVILGLPGGNLLIDTSPDMRGQLLREQIGIVSCLIARHKVKPKVMVLET